MEHDIMKKYFVQIQYEDGHVALMVQIADQILNIVGMLDCSNDKIEVFDGSTFGEVTKLEYVPATKAPFNFHQFINPKTQETEIEGYSPEH